MLKIHFLYCKWWKKMLLPDVWWHRCLAPQRWAKIHQKGEKWWKKSLILLDFQRLRAHGAGHSMFWLLALFANQDHPQDLYPRSRTCPWQPAGTCLNLTSACGHSCRCSSLLMAKERTNPFPAVLNSESFVCRPLHEACPPYVHVLLTSAGFAEAPRAVWLSIRMNSGT